MKLENGQLYITIDEHESFYGLTEENRKEYRGVIWHRRILERRSEIDYFIYSEEAGTYCLRSSRKYPGEIPLDGDVQIEIDRMIEKNKLNDWVGIPPELASSYTMYTPTE